MLTLGLVFVGLNARFNFSYDTAWCFFALRGALIYGLIVVGIQANYAAVTTPLRFKPDGAAGKVSVAESEMPEAAPTTLAATTAAEPPLSSATEAAKAEAPEVVPKMPATPTEALAETTTELPPELRPWRERLLRLMADERPWLEPELTLTELAQRLRTHPALLSKVINAGCGQNFNDFVNTYRVHEARRKLADPRFGHYSLVGVALESGFNSKSTFNRVFKKLLGQAPSEVVRPKS